MQLILKFASHIFKTTMRTLLLSFTFLILSIVLFSCKSVSKMEKPTFEAQLKLIKDSVKIGNIAIYNVFKHQIQAHSNNRYDTVLIANKVYTPHKELWNNCYAMIFGSKNAAKFNSVNGLIAWNKTLYPTNKEAFEGRVTELLSLDINSLLERNLKRFDRMVGSKPSARISILFSPFEGIGFGGCSADKFALELNNKGLDLNYTLNNGIPHELNHLAYEPHRNIDPLRKTALAQTIDEGFACYFTWVFLDRKEAQHVVVENMTKENWDWYIKNEEQIFKTVNSYFKDESGDNPLLNNRKFKLFPDAPKSLNYWLGFRIIESYVNRHGKDSWKDIYKLPIADVYRLSGYGDKFK